jgi:hypothetical protein
MKDEQDVFVSRRGNRVKLDDVDLTGVDVEEKSTTPPTRILSTKVRLHRPEIHLPRPHMSKKQAAGVALALVILLLLPLAALELLTLQYRNASASLKKDVDRIGSTIALPAQKNGDHSGIDKTVSALMTSRNGLCFGGFLDNIAGLYPRSKQALDDCNVASSNVSKVIDHLSSLKEVKAYSSAVDTALKPALAASESPYAVLPDQVASWQAAEGKLKAINAPVELKSFHNSLLQLTKDISAQWTALNNANNAADATAFKEAETKLGSFYESMRDLSPTVVGVQADIQTDLNFALSLTR